MKMVERQNNSEKLKDFVEKALKSALIGREVIDSKKCLIGKIKNVLAGPEGPMGMGYMTAVVLDRPLPGLDESDEDYNLIRGQNFWKYTIR